MEYILRHNLSLTYFQLMEIFKYYSTPTFTDVYCYSFKNIIRIIRINLINGVDGCFVGLSNVVRV